MPDNADAVISSYKNTRKDKKKAKRLGRPIALIKKVNKNSKP
jgi:hypothetical protein